jgi:GNAT superfamily N-acetyltransferase
MEIRELDKYDLADLAVLYSHLHESEESASIEILQDTWDQILATSGLYYFGLFIGDQLVSSCNLSVIPNLTRHCQPYGLIKNVVTHKLFRKQGHGTAILQHALLRAWREDCYKVMLMTGRINEATFRFYERAGFRRGEKEAFVARP